MEPCELSSSAGEQMAEDLSDRSESSRSSSSSRGGSSGGEGLHPGFQPYKGLEAPRPEDEAPRYAEYDAAEMPMALDKPKDYAVHRTDVYSESSGGEDGPPSGLLRGKEAMYSLCRDLRQMRQKSLHAAAAAAAVGKDLELIKTYGLPLERIKDFGGLRIGSIALDSLRAGPPHGETTAGLEPDDLKGLQQLSSRAPSGLPGVQDATMAFERLRHAHPLCFQSGESGQAPFLHPHQQQHHQQQQQQQPHQQQQQHQSVTAHHQQAVTQLTQMQHAGTEHSQHHQQQPKSFTIDAILGLRGGVQREKHQRHHPYRKQQGQENSVKSLTASSCSNGGNGGSNGSSAGGKLKRVRTIFTAEQLERLEGEFARQQYMVGPERLYLAHALRLTEAQVKVWFQNRRIKWRKLNHEQQSQRLHELELHQGGGGGGMPAAERDDSSENAAEW